jgi:hypothetical protein
MLHLEATDKKGKEVQHEQTFNFVSMLSDWMSGSEKFGRNRIVNTVDV